MELRAELEKRLMARIDPGLADMLDAPFAGDWKPLTAEETGVLLATVSIQLAMKGCDAPWPLAHETLALRGVSLPSHGRAVYVDAVLRLPAAPLEARRVEPSMKADDILWEVDGFVLYGSALFGATFQLAADGQIEMTDDNPIAELMPAPPGWRMAGHVKYLVPAGETPC